MADILEAELTTSGSDVTLVTTAETEGINSPEVVAPRQTVRVLILAWGQLTTGTGTTAVTPRIRRGTGTAGTLVGEANAETAKAAAGSTEPFFLLASEARADVDRVQYTLTLQQTAATGNGTLLQAAILVLILAG